jgi:hypothetical protein
MLLYHLAQPQMDQLRPYLRRMEHECITTVLSGALHAGGGARSLVGARIDTMGGKEAECMAEARLSQLQKVILDAIWSETSRLETTLEPRGESGLLARVREWGVEWHPSLWNDTWTPTDRAVLSRALRRLEQRGLVERKNERTGKSTRTTHVRLTERGREVAKWLTQ